MAMPALEPHYWTAAEVRELPDDGKRYECVDGELLVTPSPRSLHQDAVLELAVALRAYVRRHNLGSLSISPADVELQTSTLVQPDVFVSRSHDGSRVREWSDIANLLLAVEVLSPSTARYDRVVKRKFYQRAGVEQYWIVDLDARLIERWHPDDVSPEILADTLAWLPTGATEPLTLNLHELFAAICD